MAKAARARSGKDIAADAQANVKKLQAVKKKIATNAKKNTANVKKLGAQKKRAAAGSRTKIAAINKKMTAAEKRIRAARLKAEHDAALAIERQKHVVRQAEALASLEKKKKDEIASLVQRSASKPIASAVEKIEDKIEVQRAELSQKAATVKIPSPQSVKKAGWFW